MMPVIGPLIGSAFNSLGTGGTDIESAVNSVCLKITYVGLGLFAASVLQTIGCSIAGNRVMFRVKENCLRVALEQDCTFYDSTSAGKVARLMNTECTYVGDFFIDKLPVLSSTIATFISALILAFTASWDVALVALASVPVIGVVIYVTTKLSVRAEKKSKDALNEASYYAKEVLGNIRTVFSFDAGERSADTYIKKLDAPLVTGIQCSSMQGLQLGLVRFTSFGAIPLILWYGGLQVNDGKMTGGDVFSVLSPLLMAVIILAQNSNRIRSVPIVLMAAEDVLVFLNSAQEAPTDKDGEALQDLAVVSGSLELEAVRFAYPVSPDVEVLKGISLKIPAAHTAALVGESGSGKSTIVSLLLRLYEPTSGRVRTRQCF
jgi:ATP-binding cassette, subfamily B (MDR/TAP), member 1